MEVIGAIFAFSFFALTVIYMIGVWWYTQIYFIRRHGVGFSKDDEGVIGAACVGLIWPIVVFFLPDTKYPDLCTCPNHVLSRQQARQKEAAYQEALRQEREEV